MTAYDAKAKICEILGVDPRIVDELIVRVRETEALQVYIETHVDVAEFGAQIDWDKDLTWAHIGVATGVPVAKFSPSIAKAVEAWNDQE